MVMDLYGMRAVLHFLSRTGSDAKGQTMLRPVMVSKMIGFEGNIVEMRMYVDGEPRCWASLVKDCSGVWALYHSIRGPMKIAHEATVFMSDGEAECLPDRCFAVPYVMKSAVIPKGFEIYEF